MLILSKEFSVINGKRYVTFVLSKNNKPMVRLGYFTKLKNNELLFFNIKKFLIVLNLYQGNIFIKENVYEDIFFLYKLYFEQLKKD